MNGLHIPTRIRCLPRRRRHAALIHHRPLLATIRPPPPPLDPSITGLTPLPLVPREGPIRPLLAAISARRDLAIWQHFTTITATDLTARLTAADFSSILLSLRPARFVSLRARHYMSDHDGSPRLLHLRTSYERFRQRLHAVSAHMEASGYRMGVQEYTHLLDCARAGGDRPLAERLWRQMAAAGVAPDTWAYNSYMAALCGTAAVERELRVTPRTLAKRSSTPEDVRARALTVYRRMVERGVAPNSMTFDLLLLAMARMGDMAGVERTLREVWDVDVCVRGVSAAAPAVARDSPLWPTQHTLTAVAAAFGSNADVEGGVRAVDHLARRYGVAIAKPTWVMLLNWTYVAARPPLRALPNYGPLNLWEIMTSPPYSVRPTIEMYDYLVRSLVARKMHADAIAAVNRALKEVYSGEHAAARSAHGGDQAAWCLRSEFRSRSIIRRWVELLCLGKGMRPGHARQRVPDAVRRMGWFLGDRVTYVAPTGYVDLYRGKEHAWRPMSVRRRKRAWTPLGTGSKEMDYLD